MKSLRSILFFVFLLPLLLSAQDRTVGVFHHDSLAFNGYTLFTGTSSNDTYLIDNCGHQINRWKGTLRPGLAVYLLEDGSLLRTARIGSDFNAGGTGGRLERYSWEGELLWAYDYSSATVHQHHDVAPMPNGNILILAWEKKSREEILLAGRDSGLVNNEGLWLEQVVEIVPAGMGEAEIVWEWHMGDHLVQDYDATKANYGEVAMHPELLNLNYSPTGINFDWLHANAIDYNPELDQIVLSSRNFNEFWIIDHSTTTAEAASHTGGNAGRGGDLLYRWGNPQAYGRGTAEDQRLYGQHHVHWIPAGYPDEGKILLFNNGLSRPAGEFSTVEMLTPPLNSDGTYAISATEAYGPTAVDWMYQAPDFYSIRISGAQRLPNGNTLICEGNDGRFFEVNQEGDIHWEYINPIRQTGPVSQGDNISSNGAFRITRYAPDYPGLAGKDLTPGALLELNPIADSCQIYGPIMSSTQAPDLSVDWHLSPNPVDDFLQIKIKETGNFSIRILDLSGRMITTLPLEGDEQSLNTSTWFPGLYFVQLFSAQGEFIKAQKIIKK